MCKLYQPKFKDFLLFKLVHYLIQKLHSKFFTGMFGLSQIMNLLQTHTITMGITLEFRPCLQHKITEDSSNNNAYVKHDVDKILFCCQW